jgi:hypothetical protein
MKQEYRDAITKMEALNVSPEFILGWQGGFLQHPMREEQRHTDAYKAGYEEGESGSTENFAEWADN